MVSKTKARVKRTKQTASSSGRSTRNRPAKPEKKVPKWVLHELWLEQHGEEYRSALLQSIQERLPGLEALRVEAEAQWPEDRVHSFDPGSFK